MPSGTCVSMISTSRKRIAGAGTRGVPVHARRKLLADRDTSDYGSANRRLNAGGRQRGAPHAAGSLWITLLPWHPAAARWSTGSRRARSRTGHGRRRAAVIRRPSGSARTASVGGHHAQEIVRVAGHRTAVQDSGRPAIALWNAAALLERCFSRVTLTNRPRRGRPRPAPVGVDSRGSPLRASRRASLREHCDGDRFTASDSATLVSRPSALDRPQDGEIIAIEHLFAHSVRISPR